MGISRTHVNLLRLLDSAPQQQNQAKLIHYVTTSRELLEQLAAETTSEGLPSVSKVKLNEYSDKIEELTARLAPKVTGTGPDRTQDEILNPNVEPSAFGVTHAVDWPIAVGPEAGAKIVARAQGLVMQAGLSVANARHYTSFSIVFEDDRFKGSTLQGMGITLSESQWAISSGTGEFALAHGIIKQKVMPPDGRFDTNIKELHIHAFYTPMNNSVVPGATDGKSWTLGA